MGWGKRSGRGPCTTLPQPLERTLTSLSSAELSRLRLQPNHETTAPDWQGLAGSPTSELLSEAVTSLPQPAPRRAIFAWLRDAEQGLVRPPWSHTPGPWAQVLCRGNAQPWAGSLGGVDVRLAQLSGYVRRRELPFIECLLYTRPRARSFTWAVLDSCGVGGRYCMRWILLFPFSR